MDQAKRDTKAACTRQHTADAEASREKKIYSRSFSTAFARVVHSFSTTTRQKASW